MWHNSDNQVLRISCLKTSLEPIPQCFVPVSNALEHTTLLVATSAVKETPKGKQAPSPPSARKGNASKCCGQQHLRLQEQARKAVGDVHCWAVHPRPGLQSITSLLFCELCELSLWECACSKSGSHYRGAFVASNRMFVEVTEMLHANSYLVHSAASKATGHVF
jgi:hypothetical protein